MRGQSLRDFLTFVVEPEVRQFCGPVFFTRSLKVAADNVIANGSFSLVDTGKKKLLVTCYHVWDEFRNAKLNDPELKMCLCLDARNPVVFTPNASIDESEQLDIATFDMEPLLSACGERKFYPLHQAPARQVKAGDKLFFIGFPGYLRVDSPEFIAFGRAPYATGVSGVSGSGFLSDITNLKLEPHQFGGISGCPCFLVREDRPIQLIGFATSTALSYLHFVHARCLKPNGTIGDK
jgi:hypothetical protein